nr:uncharacterized protein LOC118075189 [Zootoca vivipara]
MGGDWWDHRTLKAGWRQDDICGRKEAEEEEEEKNVPKWEFYGSCSLSQQKCTVEYSSESESDADMEYVDPYDGDDEEFSGNSNSSLGSLESSRVIFLKHLSTEDSVLSEGPEPLSAFAPMEVPLIVTREDEPQLYEAAEVLQMTTEPSWFPGPGYSKHAVLPEKSPCDFVLHPMLADCDNLREFLNVKRKQGRVVLDSAGETARKKLRVT